MMGGVGQHYCLRWNNYQSNMTSVFHNLLQNEAFVDVTLACNENTLKAHKVVLSACSSYFQKLLLDNPCKHPTIILPSDICFNDLKFIIEFVYKGEIDVSQAELQSLLRTADQLKIKGLCEVPDDEEGSNSDNGFCTADVTLNTIHQMHRDGSHKSRIVTRLRSKYLANQAKKKSQYDLSKKYSKPDGNLLQASTINTFDILDTNAKHAFAKCITVATSTEEDDKDMKSGIGIPVVLLDSGLSGNSAHHLQPGQQSDQHVSQNGKIVMTGSSLMSTSMTSQQILLEHCQPRNMDDSVEMLSDAPQPSGPMATPVHVHSSSPTRRDMGVDTSSIEEGEFVDGTKVKFETLRTMDSTSDSMETLENHMSDKSIGEDDHMQTMMITPELLGLIPSNSSAPSSEVGSDTEKCCTPGSKGWSWTSEDMELALDALRNKQMSLTKASVTYGIPSTTLWQRAHRLGIDTPKKEGNSKSWNDEVLNIALEALRTGSISANKASKAYGIPSSTLYKIARKEGIRLAAPFNAAPTTWHAEDLERALEAIRSGQTTVQRASAEYGIPSGTLYGRCKREKIELSRSNPTPWSEDAMLEALETVRLGHMSINQAAIHYNLPYSSLYGRFKRGKFDIDHLEASDIHTSVADTHTHTHTPHPHTPHTSHTHAHTSVQTSTLSPALISQPQQQQQQMQSSQQQQIQAQQPPQIHSPQQQIQMQQQQQQMQQQHTDQQQGSAMQSPQQIMLLQYQHPPTPHMQMFQPTAPS